MTERITLIIGSIKKVNVHKYARRCANSNVRWLEFPKSNGFSPSNNYSCILHLHRIPENSKEGGFLKTWERRVLKIMTRQSKVFPANSLEDEKWEFVLRLTHRHHVRSSGDGGRWSQIHKTFHSYILYRHRNKSKGKKGIPLFLVLRRGYIRQRRGRAFPEKFSWELNPVLCHLLPVQPSQAHLESFTRPSFTVRLISSVQWVPVWGPGWAAAWGGVRPGGGRPWGASPSIAPAGWALPARS